MSRLTRANRQPQTRSMLLDHKNKQNTQLPNSKLLPLKTKQTKAHSRSRPSSIIETRSNSIQSQSPSPKPTLSQPLQPLKQFYTKSEEETKAEKGQVRSSQKSPIRNGKSWEGILGEYRQDIMEYTIGREQQLKIDGGYLSRSHVLTAKMRVYLIRHIYKLYDRYELMRTTLHLAVLYLDMYFSRQPYLQDTLQGIAAAQACLFIAMKYQEIYPPELRDWVDRRHRDDVVKLQAKILNVLNYQLSHYTVQHHLALQLWEQGKDIEDVQPQISLLADLSLFDLSVRQLRSDLVAQNIIQLGRAKTAPDYKIGLSLKWMVERNSDSLKWLQEQRYGHDSQFHCSL